MGVRKLMLAVVGVATVATMSSAAADYTQTEVAGFNNGLTGAIAVDGTLTAAPMFYKVVPECTFAGVLTPNNTLIVEFAGTATASTNDVVRVPQITYIKCKIKSGTLETTADGLVNGSHAGTAGSTALDPSGPKEWPVSPVTVCASGAAIFGNINPVVVFVSETCKTPTP